MEVHIFDFNKNIYSQEIIVEFVERIRDEKKFKSLEKLQAQLLIDSNNCKKVLNLFR